MIPIANIYYMLSYAFQVLQKDSFRELGTEEFHNTAELYAALMYNALAKTVKDPQDAATFRKLASEEGRHASVFHKLTGKKLRAKKGKAILLPILYRLMGRKKLYPLIAKGEYDAVKSYAPVAARFPEVESVKNDEKRHGDIVSGMLERHPQGSITKTITRRTIQ